MATKILVLHGPNLNLLGEREGDERARTLEDLNTLIRTKAAAYGVDVRIFQSNHEGELVDTLHAERRWAEGVIINPAALTHTSYVLRDALAAVGRPAIEVHLTDIRRRESWRRKSVIKDVCASQVLGKGFESYVIALERFATNDLAGRKARSRSAAKAAGRPGPTSKPGKTLGRKGPTEPVGQPALAKPPGAKDPPAAPSEAAAGLAHREVRKTLGAPRAPSAASILSRAAVRQKIADRLSGRLTPAGLATWARGQWLEVQRGAPAESGQRELLEDSLQALTLSVVPASRLSDEQLVELMAQLEG